MEHYHYVRIAIIAYISLCYAVLLVFLVQRVKRVEINWKEQLDKLLEASKEQLKGHQKWYENRKVYLARMGINYRWGRTVLPEEYLFFQILVGSVAGLAGIVVVGFPGVLAAVIGFFAPGMVYGSLNDKDNKAILKEVKNIYDTIQIKTQGGMFLTSAITECYRNTRNRRLKKALSEMSAQIIAKSNLKETIDEFNLKFKNKYIDNLCIILKQSLDSGKTVEIMKSIQDQLGDMQEAVNLQMRNRLNSRVILELVLVALAVIFICVGVSLVSIGVDIGV